MLYESNYHCPQCHTEWQDTYDCACNSECPECGLSDIEPIDIAVLGEYLYDNVEDCSAAWAHLTSVDNDGFCNHCGHQE